MLTLMTASTPVRTRFAPSPTGFLHIGGARTALFSWAYARKSGGKFILRIEDTDLERSTEASVSAILESMAWLGLDWDEGPFFQMKRLPRYKEIAEQLIAKGLAYRDYMPKQALDTLREQQAARGEKPRYDRAIGETYKGEGPAPIRFRTPTEGKVGWNDLVKGPIEFPNAELDDLVILRADGVPTYNFGVVVDDLDMGITHVIRGDDHVNNTPRQIHIFNALLDGKPLPLFGHLPMILGADGERLSKRHGAVSVTQYRDEGFLPEALVNYLARLGWSHGNDEIFGTQQFVEWFGLDHVNRSPAQFNAEKAQWTNQQHLKAKSDDLLAEMLSSFVDYKVEGPVLKSVVGLVKDRAATLPQLAQAARLFYVYEKPADVAVAEVLNDKVKPALKFLMTTLATAEWNKAAISEVIKTTLKTFNLKMPELAIPARVLVTGQKQTPSLDAVLELLGRETVISRLAHYLD
jgi:glutamyl-tRNA synthetase